MKEVSCETYTAKAVIGLQKGYSNVVITKKEFKKVLTEVQRKIKTELGIFLSANIYECEIFFLGQDEPSMTIEFINYPKFSLDFMDWKNGVMVLFKELMDKLEQNRIVIVFNDETIMFEKQDNIDPLIDVS